MRKPLYDIRQLDEEKKLGLAFGTRNAREDSLRKSKFDRHFAITSRVTGVHARSKIRSLYPCSACGSHTVLPRRDPSLSLLFSECHRSCKRRTASRPRARRRAHARCTSRCSAFALPRKQILINEFRFFAHDHFFFRSRKFDANRSRLPLHFCFNVCYTPRAINEKESFISLFY